MPAVDIPISAIVTIVSKRNYAAFVLETSGFVGMGGSSRSYEKVKAIEYCC